jgi:hypothetical protein
MEWSNFVNNCPRSIHMQWTVTEIKGACPLQIGYARYKCCKTKLVQSNESKSLQGVHFISKFPLRLE